MTTTPTTPSARHGRGTTDRLPARPRPGTYELDPARTRLRFTTRHLFGLGSVHGSFAVTGGQALLAAPDAAGRAGSTLAVAIGAGSIDTGSAARDRAVRAAAFLDVAAHPEITFVATQLSATSTGWSVPGQLVVRGTATTVDLRIIDITEDGAGASVRASARIDRHAHGLTRMKGLAARYLDIDLTVRANLV